MSDGFSDVLPAGLPTTSITSGAMSPNDAAGLLDAMALFERQLIERAIVAADGNRAQAARELKISYRWLLKKLERYGAAVSGLG